MESAEPDRCQEIPDYEFCDEVKLNGITSDANILLMGVIFAKENMISIKWPASKSPQLSWIYACLKSRLVFHYALINDVSSLIKKTVLS